MPPIPNVAISLTPKRGLSGFRCLLTVSISKFKQMLLNVDPQHKALVTTFAVHMHAHPHAPGRARARKTHTRTRTYDTDAHLPRSLHLCHTQTPGTGTGTGTRHDTHTGCPAPTAAAGINHRATSAPRQERERARFMMRLPSFHPFVGDEEERKRVHQDEGGRGRKECSSF